MGKDIREWKTFVFPDFIQFLYPSISIEMSPVNTKFSILWTEVLGNLSLEKYGT